MKTNKALLTALILLATLAALGLTSCKPKERVRSATEKHYDLKGKIVIVNKENHEITIAHEDIKDYMNSMTMPFHVDADWVFDIAAPGNQITATLVVDGTSSWLEDVVVTDAERNVHGRNAEVRAM